MDRLKLSDCESLDTFLEKKDNREFLEIGKDALAVALIDHEHFSERDHLFSGDRDWYSQLLDLLIRGSDFDEVTRNKLSIITFNYDRSLEYYLTTSLSSLYDRSMEESQEIIQALSITHVHGRIGRLPWERVSRDTPNNLPSGALPFGGKPFWPWPIENQKKAVFEAARGIKIISEDIDDTPDFIKARVWLRDADKTFFLGFGFHPTNMRRLRLTELENHFVQCTTLGLSADRHRLLDQFTTTTGSAIFSSPRGTGHAVRHNKTIHQFIHEVGL